MTRGRLITFEGGEGTGKSTQSKKLAHFLEEKGIKVHLTREPGGTSGADKIRELVLTGEPLKWDVLTEFLLMSASRREHIQRVVMPLLREEVWVVSDRFFDSSWVYQGFAGGLELSFVQALNERVCDGLSPDVTFILNIKPEEGLRRALGRESKETRFEKKESEFHKKVAEGFLRLPQFFPARKFCVLSTEEREESVFENIIDFLKKRGYI